MATQYDFQNIERELSSLEKQLNDFDKEFESKLSPILNASFNTNEYGERALEQRVDKLVNQAKRDANSIFNDFINDVRRYSHSAMQTIKASAKDICSYVDSLNQTLDSVNNLNAAYANNDYDRTILLADGMRGNNDNAEIAKYALLVELDAYDKLCIAKSGNFKKDDYSVFRKYYSLCKNNNAKRHITSASMQLFIAAYKMVSENRSSLQETELYRVCIDGLKGYDGIDAGKQSDFAHQYQEIYQCGITLFNKKAEAAYTSFDYISVKNFIAESVYFKTEDINNKFFADSNLSPERVFNYLKEYGWYGSGDSIDAAFDDSKALAVSSERETYIGYWISCYDKFGWKYCNESINMQENRYHANALISKIIIENYTDVRLMPELALHLYKNYNEFLISQDRVDLDLFLESAVELNTMVNVFAKTKEANDQGSPMFEAVRGFDGLSYGMITKYLKICSRYNDAIIKNLNVVLDDSSNRLYGKSYRKDLRRDENTQPVEKTFEKVKLVSAQSQEKKKKTLIAVGVAAAIIVVVIIIIVLSGK